jgi:hypothetical protein
MPHKGKRSAKDIGSQSPASGSAKEQAMHGAAGGPQGEQPAGIGKQPSETSNRRSAKHEHLRQETKSFTPEEDPSKQGKPNRSAESIKRDESLQGLVGRSQASGTRSNDVQEEADRD